MPLQKRKAQEFIIKGVFRFRADFISLHNIHKDFRKRNPADSGNLHMVSVLKWRFRNYSQFATHDSPINEN